jgi:VanZ family protein
MGVFILVLSMNPRPLPLPPGPIFMDKIEHFLSYVVLGACAMLSLNRKRLPGYFFVIAICSLYGGVIEIVQPLVGRTRDIWDFTADLAGSALGAAIVLLLARGKRFLYNRRSRDGGPED